MKKSITKLHSVKHGFMGCSISSISYFTHPATLERKLILGYSLCDLEGEKEQNLISLNGHRNDSQQMHIEKIVEDGVLTKILICMEKSLNIVFLGENDQSFSVKTVQYVYGLRRMRGIRGILFLRGYKEFLMIGFGSNTAQKYVIRSALMNLKRINQRSRYLSQSRHYGFDVIYEHPKNNEPVECMYQLRKFDNQIVIGAADLTLYDHQKCIRLAQFRPNIHNNNNNNNITLHNNNNKDNDDLGSCCNPSCFQCISSYISSSKGNHEIVVAGSSLGVHLVDVESKTMFRHVLRNTYIQSLIRVNESEFVLGGIDSIYINFEDSKEEEIYDDVDNHNHDNNEEEEELTNSSHSKKKNKSKVIDDNNQQQQQQQPTNIFGDEPEMITSFCVLERNKNSTILIAGTNQNKFLFYSLNNESDMRERAKFLFEYPEEYFCHNNNIEEEEEEGIRVNSNQIFLRIVFSEVHDSFFLFKSLLV